MHTQSALHSSRLIILNIGALVMAVDLQKVYYIQCSTREAEKRKLFQSDPCATVRFLRTTEHKYNSVRQSVPMSAESQTTEMKTITVK